MQLLLSAQFCPPKYQIRYGHRLLLTFAIRGDTEHQGKPYIKRSLSFAKIDNNHRMLGETGSPQSEPPLTFTTCTLRA